MTMAVMAHPQYLSPPTPARASFHDHDVMAPATGYADASSDMTKTSAIERIPDIGHATSCGQLWVYHRGSFASATHNHHGTAIPVRAGDGKDGTLTG